MAIRAEGRHSTPAHKKPDPPSSDICALAKAPTVFTAMTTSEPCPGWAAPALWEKVKFKNMLEQDEPFETAPSPVYGEQNFQIAYRCLDILWRPPGRVVQFVRVKHPSRGRIMLMTTIPDFSPSAVARPGNH